MTPITFVSGADANPLARLFVDAAGPPWKFGSRVPDSCLQSFDPEGAAVWIGNEIRQSCGLPIVLSVLAKELLCIADLVLLFWPNARLVICGSLPVHPYANLGLQKLMEPERIEDFVESRSHYRKVCHELRKKFDARRQFLGLEYSDITVGPEQRAAYRQLTRFMAHAA